MEQFIQLDAIEPSASNVFLLWGGPLPGPEYLDQIRVCVRSIHTHIPNARIHLFSNGLEPLQLRLPEMPPFLVRWDPDRLANNSPFPTPVPSVTGSWRAWSNVFRLLCLWKWGGTYIDVDDIALRAPPPGHNLMAACFLTDQQTKRWSPWPAVPGTYATVPPTLPAEAPFRFGADPMTRFSPENPFLEGWLQRIPTSPVANWGQVVPTQIFSENPAWARSHVHPIPWPDLLYHGYDEGHHPADKRYSQTSISASQTVRSEAEASSLWQVVIRSYGFFLIKNHNFRLHLPESKELTVEQWAVQHYFRGFAELER